MEASELSYLSLRSLATLIQRQEVSPVEATQAALDRVEKFDRQLNSFITVLRDQALVQARAAEQEIRNGNYRGPLHGVPTYDATVIARWRDAGAILVGKLNIHDFARGATKTTKA